MDLFELFNHDLRIANLRLLLNLERTPAEVERLNQAMKVELARCERVGCGARDDHDPTLLRMRRLAEALNVSVAELMG